MEETSPPEAPTPPPPPSKGRGMWIGLIVVVIVIVILLAAVFGGLLGPPEERVLKIGTVLSITGGLAAFGGKNRQGVIMAVEEINAAGGVLGQPIQLFHQNDDTKPETARSAAATLVSQNHVDAIVGATGSGQCATVIEVAKANGVFEISGSCTSPRFSNATVGGGWWARTVPSDALQGVVAASYALRNLTYSRAAVIAVRTVYGLGVGEMFADSFIRFGGTLTAPLRSIDEIVSPPTSYSVDLQAVLNTNPPPQLLYVVAYPPEGVQLVRDFEAGKSANPQWANVRLMFSEGVFDQASFVDVLRNPPNNIDTSGFLGTAPAAYAGIVGPGHAAWADAYAARWGSQPGMFDDNNYDAAYVLALAAEAAGDSSGAAIRSKIRDVTNAPGTRIHAGEWAKARAEIASGHDIDYEGASGSVELDAVGDPTGAYAIWGVDGAGRLETRDVFPESLVIALLPTPPMPAPPIAPTRGRH